MVLFRCPYCGLETNVEDRYAGQTGPCAGCNKPVTVPSAAESQATVSRKAADPATGIPLWLRVALMLAVAVLGLLAVGLGGSSLLRPVVRAVRSQSQQARCARNIQTIVDALHAYQAEHGHLPPAYTVDASGKPLLSWRVLLLPYLGPEAKSLYAQLNLQRSWDSPENSVFHLRIPAVYTCPVDQPFAPGNTSYCVVSGPGYAFHQDRPTRAEQITDERALTLLVVEVRESAINWMEPKDVGPDLLASGINCGRPGCCGSFHEHGGMTVGLADGTTAVISSVTSPDTLREMATVAGGERPEPTLPISR
jgi:hypothetical protein